MSIYIHRGVSDPDDLEPVIGFPEDDDVAFLGVGVEPGPELGSLVPESGVPRQPSDSNRYRIDVEVGLVLVPAVCRDVSILFLSRDIGNIVELGDSSNRVQSPSTNGVFNSWETPLRKPPGWCRA